VLDISMRTKVSNSSDGEALVLSSRNADGEALEIVGAAVAAVGGRKSVYIAD
jgi:hypothetical protein